MNPFSLRGFVSSLPVSFLFGCKYCIPGNLESQISIKCSKVTSRPRPCALLPAWSLSVSFQPCSAKFHIFWTAWSKCLRPKHLWNMSNLLNECKGWTSISCKMFSLSCPNLIVPMSTPSLEVDLAARSKIFTTSAVSILKTFAILSVDMTCLSRLGMCRGFTRNLLFLPQKITANTKAQQGCCFTNTILRYDIRYSQKEMM